MQLKEKPELNQINQKSEASVKTYQPDRPIKERKSVTTSHRQDLQPITEPKSVATVDRTNLQPLKEPKSVPKTDRTNLQPLKEPKSVPTTDRTNLQPIKQRKSVATVDRQDLQTIKKCKSVAKTYQPHFLPIKEHKSGGGTLRIIEPFVVLIIIGILAHIALPSFLDCSLKARQSEGKQYLGSMNRAQQAYFADKGAFPNSVNDLGINIKTQTPNYKYSTISIKNAAFSYAVSSHERKSLTSYVGAVFLVPVSPAANDAKTTVSILCGATSFGKTQPANPILQNGVPVCGDGTVEVSK
ncbi:MAG: type IV pilin-like G/H family protein [Microcoleus sp.]|uniref:type IV pilin-like G/H family protein n=1 Tax=Microcoleus sp. TaxID=44472 RepID=UPI003C78896E